MLAVKGKSPAFMRIMTEMSAVKRTTLRQARQLAEGIPAEWTKRKAQSYRSFRDRCAEDGRGYVSPEAWEAGEGRKKPGRESARPEGWTDDEWRSYRAHTYYCRDTKRVAPSPEEWRASVSRILPETFKARSVWKGRRKERQAAAVARMLKIAEQESRRRVA